MKIFRTPKGTELQIMDIMGKDYLQVDQRIVWFREEHPEWSIVTEFSSIDATSAFCKATIYIPNGQIMATAHKFEDKAGFADFREKAETGAIGRALALIGYGTQFCADEFDEGERLADSPISKPNPHAAKNMQPGPGDGIQEDDGIYRFNFGQWNRRTVSEVYNTDGPASMKSRIEYWENLAKKEGKPLRPEVAQAITEIEKFLGNVENSR